MLCWTATTTISSSSDFFLPRWWREDNVCFSSFFYQHSSFVAFHPVICCLHPLICGLSPCHLWSMAMWVEHWVKIVEWAPCMVIALLGFEVSSCMKPKAKWRSVDDKNIWHNINYIFVILLIINYLYLTNTLPNHFLPSVLNTTLKFGIWNLETFLPFTVSFFPQSLCGVKNYCYLCFR